MEAVLSLLLKLLLLFYQIRYSKENNRHSFGFQKCKQQMESMSEQLQRFIAVFQIMQKSDFRDK